MVLPSFKYSNKATLFATIAVIVMLFSLHIPFLSSDPDANISFSRDVFTDEGLNSIQTRHYVLFGDLDVLSCDNFLKTPLFQLFLFANYSIFGISVEGSRLMVLLFSFLVLFVSFANKDLRTTGVFIVIIIHCNYYLFQYLHFSLAESLSSSCIILSIAMFYRGIIEKKNAWVYWAAICLWLPVLFKIQFLYILLFMPVIAFWRMVFKDKNNYNAFVVLFIFIALSVLMYGSYYLPFREEWQLLFAGQSGSLNPKEWSVISAVKQLVSNVFNQHNALFFILTAVLQATIVIQYKSIKKNKLFVLWVMAALWTLLEMHKFLMVYLPSRYLVSFYFSVSLLASVSIVLLLQTRIKASKYIVLISIVTLMVFGSIEYHKLYTGRLFEMKAATKRFGSLPEKSVVLGAWAPSYTWNSKVYAYPVWYGFLNYSDSFIKVNNKAIIFSEKDQAESNFAWKSLQINIDSTHQQIDRLKAGKWRINVYKPIEK